jgi:hypothetical protein
MKEVLKSALLAAMLLSAPVAHAGGPVIIEEGNDELIADETVRSPGILPILGVLVLACLIACGGGGGGGGAAPAPSPEPGPGPGPAPGAEPAPAPVPEPQPEPEPEKGKW